MTLKVLSNLVLKFYENGTIKITDVKLSQSVIEAYIRTSYGAVIQSILDKKKSRNELDGSYLISGAIQTVEVELKKSGNKKVIDTTALQMMRLDNAMQIVAFDIVEDEGSCVQQDELDSITYVSPTEVRFYQGAGYGGLYFFTLTNNAINIYNTPDCLTKLQLQYASSSSDIDLPEDVCLQICKISFPDIFGVKKFEKQKVDDYSNQFIEAMKLQIAANSQ